MTINAFLDKIDEIDAEKPRYRLGGTGKDGTCDCIGLIVGAMRRADGKWSGIVGSNWTARYGMQSLSPTKEDNLQPGMLVFKGRKSTAKLPGRYKKGGYCYNGDLTDYYHVGVVRSVAPLTIVHCTSPTVKHTSNLRGWSYAGFPIFLEIPAPEPATEGDTAHA